MRYVCPARTSWYDPFFAVFAGATGDEIVAAAEEADLEDAARRDRNLREHPLSGWAYWTLFLQGYGRFRRRGAVPPDEPYVEYLVRRFGPDGHDPGLAPLLRDPATAALRVQRRFEACDLLAAVSAGGTGGALGDLHPVLLDPGTPSSPDPKVVFDAETGEPMWVSAIDGYHRLFAARLFGVAGLPCRIASLAAADAPPARTGDAA